MPMDFLVWSSMAIEHLTFLLNKIPLQRRLLPVMDKALAVLCDLSKDPVMRMRTPPHRIWILQRQTGIHQPVFLNKRLSRTTGGICSHQPSTLVGNGQLRLKWLFDHLVLYILL